MWFPDLRPALVLMFWLSVIGLLAMIGGGIALIVWLFTHVSVAVT